MDKDIFILREAKNIVKRYKISEKTAEERLYTALNANKHLLLDITKANSIEEIKRLSTYKTFIKKLKKDIYYSLRQYHQEGISGSTDHVSTNERDPYIEEFNEQIINRYPNVRDVIDIGGGVYPLTFPFNKFSQLEHYVWIDKDKKAYESLLKLENPKLHLYHEPVGERPWESYLPEGVSQFDLALMLKLVSVVGRQERELVKLLTEVPAKTVLITSPKESMTKKESIERRERNTLKKFIKLSGRTIAGELDIENEFGYFLDS